MRSALLGLALIILGAVIFTYAFSAYPHMAQDSYHHEVWETNNANIEQEHEVYQFQDLSDDGQHAFLSALNSSDNEYVSYGEERKALEFKYGDEISGIFIKYNDEYYVIETWEGSGIGILDELGFYGILFAGFMIAGIGCFHLGNLFLNKRRNNSL